jgi:putative radical SAM enzyme (TIGR03279 family)
VEALTVGNIRARVEASQGARVCLVNPGSPAHRAGLLRGDIITYVNGEQMQDFLDFYAAAFAENLKLRVIRGGSEREIKVRRSQGRNLGVEIDSGKPRLCNNKCIFCFVDQMPPGLRENLYVKDEDYRHSFLHGNYLTLTNLEPADEERIARMNLWPLYVSVHATDEEVRTRLLGRKPREGILSVIDRLGHAGARFHTQVVVIPGINDGATLKRSLLDLCQRRDYVQSISVVPVGITCHRHGLYPLKPVDSRLARAIIGLVNDLQIEMLSSTDTGFVYASDELFVLSGSEIPPGSWYDDYPQLDNGVGLLRTLLDSTETLRLPRSLRGKRVRFVTGVLAVPYIEKISGRLTRMGLEVEVVVAENTLFGPTVTVSGLLAGKDILEALSGVHGHDAIVLPPNVLNADGLTLDDMPICEMSRKLRSPVVMGDYDMRETISRLRDALSGRT